MLQRREIIKCWRAQLPAPPVSVHLSTYAVLYTPVNSRPLTYRHIVHTHTPNYINGHVPHLPGLAVGLPKVAKETSGLV